MVANNSRLYASRILDKKAFRDERLRVITFVLSVQLLYRCQRGLCIENKQRKLPKFTLL